MFLNHFGQIILNRFHDFLSKIFFTVEDIIKMRRHEANRKILLKNEKKNYLKL